jgi:hypothetical protein
MCRIQDILLPALALVVTAGCVRQTPPAPPESVAQAMESALLDTGFYQEVTVTRTVGRHYVPADDAWTIVACFAFDVPDGRQGSSCLDSFTATRLDNGSWLVGVTANGVYRWRALPAEADAAAPAGAPGQPGGQQPGPSETEQDADQAPAEPPPESAARPDEPAAGPQ